jgi:hypothetical protein
MIMTIDLEPLGASPDTMAWVPPVLLGQDGQGAPVMAPYHTCRLSYGNMMQPDFERWQEVWDGATHLIDLPHPYTGDITPYTCYVQTLNVNQRTRPNCPVTMGVDITLTRIQVV